MLPRRPNCSQARVGCTMQDTSVVALRATTKETPYTPNTGAYPDNGLVKPCVYPDANQGKPPKSTPRSHSHVTQTGARTQTPCILRIRRLPTKPNNAGKRADRKSTRLNSSH